MADKKKTEQQLNIYKGLCIVLMLVLIVIVGKFGFDKWIEYRANSNFEKLQELVNTPVTDDAAGENNEIIVEPVSEIPEEEYVEDITAPAKNMDWVSLKGRNQDIYAWIYIPGVEIDYPILQSSIDDEYYLNYNLDGSKGYPGCIYTEMANSKDFTDFNTVIYGHNMKSGSMFRKLHEYEDRAYFDNNRYMYIYTEDSVLVYKIYAAYTADDSHILNTNDFASEEGCEGYLGRSISMADANGNYDSSMSVTKDSHIVTLSTCTSRADQRYLVQGVLVQRGKY